MGGSPIGNERDLEIGRPPTAQDGFVRVEGIRGCGNACIAVAALNGFGNCHRPLDARFIRVADQQVVVLIVQTEPIQHAGGWAGAVGVDGGNLGVHATLPECLREE